MAYQALDNYTPESLVARLPPLVSVVFEAICEKIYLRLVTTKDTRRFRVLIEAYPVVYICGVVTLRLVVGVS